jgi:NitT/TauT family transport system substrate-binding protein
MVTQLTRYRMRAALAGLAVMLLTALSSMPAAAQDLKEASIRLKWLPQAQFIGYFVAKEKGWYEEEGIDLTINPGGPNIIAENMVGSGADTFGHAGGAASLLRARSKGLPILGIGMMFQLTPYRFIALEESGIKEFSDVKGKTVSTWFSGPQFIFQGMLRSNGIPIDEVTIEAQANSMVPFLEGEVDVATVTVYNEALVLKRKGITPATVFNPAELGVNLPNESLIVSEETVKNDPELVQGFLNASLRGWAYALTHQDEAIDILLEVFPSADRTEQKEQLEQLVELITYGVAKQEGIGYIDVEQMNVTNQLLLDSEVLDELVDVPSAIVPSFWEAVPEEYKVISKMK